MLACHPTNIPRSPPSPPQSGDESSFTAEGEEDAGTLTDSWMQKGKRNVEGHV